MDWEPGETGRGCYAFRWVGMGLVKAVSQRWWLQPPCWRCGVGGEWVGSAALLVLWAPTRHLGCSSVTKEKARLHLGRLMPSLCHIISDTALSCHSGAFILRRGLPGTQAEMRKQRGLGAFRCQFKKGRERRLRPDLTLVLRPWIQLMLLATA